MKNAKRRVAGAALATAALVLLAWRLLPAPPPKVAPAVETSGAHEEAPTPVTQPPSPPTRGADGAPLRSLRGRVVSDEGLPVAGALVGSTAPAAETARTDAAGQFRMHGVPSGWIQVYAVAPGHADRHVLLEPGQSDVELVLPREASILASLRGPAPSELLASICRPLDPMQDTPFCLARVVVQAGQQTFSLARLPSGAHELWIEAGDQILLKVPVETRAGEQLELRGLEMNAAGGTREQVADQEATRL